jgi:DNA polymerase III sliding clamp (beta) subunit (PCNA family)
LPQEFFDMFHFPEKEFFVGLNVEDMTGLFKGISGDTSVEFRVIGNGWVLLELESASSTRQFKLRAVDIGGQKERRLDIPFQFKAELSTGLYQDIVSFLKLGSEQAVFLASEEELAVESATYSRINKMLIFKDSPYVIQYSLKAPKDGAEENTTNEEPCIRALYSTKFLKKFLAGTKLSDSFMLEFSKNKPMKLTFPIPGGGTLAYAVAPRLEY